MNKKGVTLVELLIVLVIMGFLALITVPIVTRVLETAEKDSIMAEAGTLRNSTVLYCMIEECDEATELTSVELSGFYGGYLTDYTVNASGYPEEILITFTRNGYTLNNLDPRDSTKEDLTE